MDPCKKKEPEVSLQPARALYVHVPFCVSKCRYCDFYSLRHDIHGVTRYLQAVRAEVRMRRSVLERPLRSLFLGGGTPTVLGPTALAELLDDLLPLTDSDTEISIEANPASINADMLRTLAGRVNRINLGVQSFANAELSTLGRVHDRQEALEAWKRLRDICPGNMGLDLIYGIPGQSLHSWQESVSTALGLWPDHISAYSLSFERGTPLEADLQAGKLHEISEDLQEQCYRHLIDAARRAGLEHYEISNFAAEDKQCVHNLTYWHNLPYVGVGPAAAGYVHGVRRTNLPDLNAWAAALRAGREPAAETEKLPPRLSAAETLMLGLRLRRGVNRREFAGRFGRDPVEMFPRSFDKFRDHLCLDATSIRLRESALFVADTILAEIISEAG
ncbi:MAG: radical SAM family heme chaperone HemW [Phycisphaerae bacterium]